uniref:Uncharacterized protein n=1 Tax=Esox lucius TaxID=8010 RepID=A0AAY5JW22_ESOLU
MYQILVMFQTTNSYICCSMFLIILGYVSGSIGPSQGKECGKSSYSLDRNQLDKPSSPKGQTASGRADPNLHFSFYPPVPPFFFLLQDFLPPIPPPPPPSTCVRPPQPGHVEPGNGLDSVMTDLSTMLLSWYLCGYHTGCYTVSKSLFTL